jgi:CRISPR-associated protein Cas1
MLNEFTYCERLGYLEWVDGEWADNFETREGSFDHRNVDKPDRKKVEGPESRDEDQMGRQGDDAIHARSIMLSAPGEGLVAKLDLLEMDGDAATPVDYKRGKVPDVPEGAYEPERVQLCAQGLILRENGFSCTAGVIYYVGSRRRVNVEFDDALVARTRELVNAFRCTAEAGVIPPPLVDSPKCPRCSLVGICLPDEVNLLRELREGEPQGAESGSQPIAHSSQPIPHGSRPIPRRLLPARDDALPLYVQEQGAMVGKSGDRLTVSRKSEQLASMRLIDVSQVCLFGNSMITAPAMKELASRGVPICHFSYGGWFYAITAGLAHKNVELGSSNTRPRPTMPVRSPSPAGGSSARSRTAGHFCAGT